MNARLLLLVAFLVLILGFGARESAATLARPNAEFYFSAPTSDPKDAVTLLTNALTPLGFEADGRVRVSEDGFLNAAFERPPTALVSVMGQMACVRVAIYTFGQGPDPATEASRQAAQVYDSLIASLRESEKGLKLFKPSSEERQCKEAL